MAYIQVLTEKGIPMEILFIKNFFQYYRENCVGKSGQDNCENQLNWCRENGFNLGMNWREYHEARKKFYEPVEGSIPLINKNIEFVRRIKSRYSDFPFYIVSRTDVPRTSVILKRAVLEEIVDVVVVPDKNMSKYELAVDCAKARGIDVESCLAIEDSQEGVNEAGIYKIPTIVVPAEFTDKSFFHGAFFKTNELKDYIR